VEEENRQKVQTKREVAADSLQKYQFEILDLENNAGVAGELGPLQYLSGLTGIPMDKIINILLLTIIFVFDPLAISLVIAANFAFAQAFPKREEDVLSVFDNDEKWDDGIDEAINLAEEAQDKINKENKNFNLGDWDEDKGEKRMNIIGRNGNDGEHYEELSSKYEDTSIEIRTLKDKILSIDEYLNKNAPYYGKKSEVTKSVDEPIIENKLRSAPKTLYNPGYDISEDHRDQDDAKTY
jgi:hypothetical protein